MALIKCAKCDREYSDTLNKCPHCNYEPNFKICPECGKISSKNEKSCPYCGFKLADSRGKEITKEILEAEYSRLLSNLDEANSEEEFEKVKENFEMLGDYKDSKIKMKFCSNALEYASLIRLIIQYKTSDEWEKAKKKFEALGDYKDSAQKVIECENNRIQALYKEVIDLENSGTAKTEELIQLYENLGDYEDAAERLKQCKKKLEEEIEYIQHGKKKKLIILGCVIGIIILGCIGHFGIMPGVHYKNAEKAMKAGDYDVAVREYKKANGHEDAEAATHYAEAKKAYTKGDYDVAYEEYRRADDYKDARKQAVAAKDGAYYSKGKKEYEKGEYEKAAESFRHARDFKDAGEMANKANYYYGIELLVAGEYEKAEFAFGNAGQYDNASALLLVSSAERCLSLGLADLAIKDYSNVPDDVVVEGFDVQGRKALLLGGEDLAAASGIWVASESHHETMQVHDSTGISNSWYNDQATQDEMIEITADFTSDGTIGMRGKVSYYFYDDFSVVNEYNELKFASFDFEIPNITSMPAS